MGAHVDDMLATGTDSGIAKMGAALGRHFTIKTMKDPKVITGVQMVRSRKHRWTKIHQEGYILKLLKSYKMEDCKPASIPLDPGITTPPYRRLHLLSAS